MYIIFKTVPVNLKCCKTLFMLIFSFYHRDLLSAVKPHLMGCITFNSDLLNSISKFGRWIIHFNQRSQIYEFNPTSKTSLKTNLIIIM